MSQIKIGRFFIGRQINESEWLAHAVINESMRYATVKITEIEEPHKAVVNSQPALDQGEFKENEVRRGLSRPRQVLGVSDGLEPDHDPTWLNLGESPRVGDVGKSSERKVSLLKQLLHFLQTFRKTSAFVAGVLCVVGISALVFAPTVTAEHVATQARPTPITTQAAPTPTSLPSISVTGEWFRIELAKKPITQSTVQIASQLNWSMGQELASRLISQAGDVGLYALCGIDAKAQPKCVNVVVETDARGSHIREMIKPAA
jgi:hypothetical protein